MLHLDHIEGGDRIKGNKIIEHYPNATIGEIRKNAKKMVSLFPYVPGHPRVSKRYKKGNFVYLIHGYDITAFYAPSQKQKLKIMFEWKPKKRKWTLLTYGGGPLPLK